MMTFVGMPRALVTLRHTPDRRSVEAALQRIGYTVRATDDHAVSEVLLHSFRPVLLISDAIDLFPIMDASRNRIHAPVDEHAELRLVPPGHPGFLLFLGFGDGSRRIPGEGE